MPAPLLPLDDFFRNPDKTGFSLSPDGARIAWLQSWQNRMNLYARRLDGEDEIRLTESVNRDIREYFWANDRCLAWVQDTDGDENDHLFAIDVDGAAPRELTPFAGVRIQMVDELRDCPDELLVGMNRRNPQFFDVYRVNIISGAMRMIAQNPGHVAQWLCDHSGRLRAAVTADGVHNSLLYRDTEDEPFREIERFDFRMTLAPLAFTFDNRRLWVLANLHRDTLALYEYDPHERRLGEPLFAREDVDADNILFSEHEQKLAAVSYCTDRVRLHFFDPDWARLYDDLTTRLPGRELKIAGRSRNEHKLLVRTYSDLSRGGYYLLDRDTDELTKLTDVAPWLHRRNMAPMQPISYTSRDGLTIHGYLTLPQDVEPRNLPLVVLPHGGPYRRDKWGYEILVQFLANRGYAVLQMNYRGSLGYGRRFWELSFKQWGGAMQNDVTDGVQFVIAQGIADPTRVGIVGSSFGGYVALAGMAFTPQLFACGVDYSGVSDPIALLLSIPPYWEQQRQMLYAMVGHPETDAEMLRAVSPLHHAENIRKPLLIVQGANDPRVKKHTTDAMVERLRAVGVEVEYIVKDNEGHGFLNQENRIEVYRATERFLARYLGGRVE